ncbi:MAG: 50S ribosomal protein L25 [Candidatus Curtissbacteria bacterium]|nr:50S ribosomal protein L25 [Candidatus Curtissbacteria bacterium]
MEQIPLSAQPRTVLGKKVKTLRKEGVIPAHVFGHKIETIHVQVNAEDFKKVFEKAGETGIIDLSIDKDKRPVMVRAIQVHPMTDDPLHIDFYQVNLTEKVNVNVPLEIVGEAPAEEKKVGLLLTPVSEIEVEALPTDIPENLEVDVSRLAAIGDEIKIKDLPIDRDKVEVMSDEELVVAQIGELVTKEMEEVEAEIEAEQAEVEAEAAAEAPVEGAEAGTEGEGEKKPEGEQKDQGGGKEDKPPEEAKE